MPGQSSAVVMKKLELRKKALEANRTELPQMEVPLQKVDAVLTEMKDLSAQQASLTATKQGVSKRLAELKDEGQKLLTFVDVGIREHYGTRSERLVEFGQQPFRSLPRLKLVGLDGKPLKPGSVRVEPAATPAPVPPPNE